MTYPMCECCSHIIRADKRPSRAPATYIWYTNAGNEIKLCLTCCASLRRTAAREPLLQPTRIKTLTPPPE